MISIIVALIGTIATCWKWFFYLLGIAIVDCFIAPKLPENKDKDFLKKKTYGKVPKYIEKHKKEIEDEYQLVRELQLEEQNERD